MTVVSVVKGADPEVLKLGLSDGSSFFVRVSYLANQALRLEVGTVLDEDADREVRFAEEATRAERAALRLVSAREHSRAALVLKLRQRGFSNESLRAPIERLESLHLLSDQRFAEAWIRSRISRKNEGPARLSAALRARGVSREIIQRALSEVIDEETEIGLILRYLNDGAESIQDELAVRSRLRALGFSSSSIREALDRLAAL